MEVDGGEGGGKSAVKSSGPRGRRGGAVVREMVCGWWDGGKRGIVGWGGGFSPSGGGDGV